MKRFLILLVTMATCVSAWAAEPYAVYNQSDKTLTFYYGNKPAGAFSLNSGSNLPEWYNYGASAAVQKVVFNSSFVQARPTSTYAWFSEMENLTRIKGLSYLNTSNVTNMAYMFLDCINLPSLDVSSFNTSKVTNMAYMFCRCEDLTSLDLSSFNTANVTNMNYMFDGCRNLTSLDLSSFNTKNVTNMRFMFNHCHKITSLDVSNFNTANVTSMYSMFSGCSDLTSLDLSNFNTVNVTDMMLMFYECSNLTSLDLSGFNTANVKYMSYMFAICSKLKTITVRCTWSTETVFNSLSMFKDCFELVGGAGTTYDSNQTDAAYAHIDGGPSNPGYFTANNSAIHGDVNGDDIVTAADITALYEYLLNNDSRLIVNGDQTGDGLITAADITAVYGVMLSN